MDETQIRTELKGLIIKELNLQGRDPESIEDDAPLFGPPQNGKGLGLDSLDALQLAMSVEERFGVRIPEGDEARPIFRCVATLAAHVFATGALVPVPSPAG
jgi:acyl carrier protein